MTYVVASLTQPDVDAVVAAAAACDADVVEVRLDLLDEPSVEAVERLAKALAKPALATLRVPADGGRFAGEAEERERILAAAIDAGFAYVDVEADAPFLPALAARARARGTRLVVSRHLLAGTPPASEILAFLRRARDAGAWCGKLATTLAAPADAAQLVEAALAARADGLRFALMATNDATLRALAPALGSALAYGSAGAPAAPGQLPVAELQRLHAAAPPALGPATRLAVLLGHPVTHSRSPPMQNAGFRAAGVDAAYVALDVPPERLAEALGALRLGRFLGANVTVPHKEAAARHVDHLAPSARDVGAVNVVAREDGRLVGHNTDGEGALRALVESGVAVRGAHVLVLGAGGAARAVAHALRHAGASVTVTNRTTERATGLARDLEVAVVPWERRDEAAADADVVVNCTSVGLREGETPLDPTALRADAALLDAAYRPGGTDLVRAARRRRLRVVAGEAMLLHQGAAAFELWTGLPAPLEAMRRALAAAMEPRPHDPEAEP